MYAFTLERPASVADAAKLVAAGAKPLAGGQTLLASMKLRLASPETLADLGGIAELAGIRREGNALVIGAMTRHMAVAESAEVQGAIPGLADPRIQQSASAPTFNIDVNRTQAQQLGLTTRDVTNSLVVNLAGSSQVAPTFWLNPVNGVSYPIVMQTPQYQLDSLEALSNLPIGTGTAAGNATLGALASFGRGRSSALVSQYDVQPMVQLHAATQDRDLGAVAADIRRVLADTKAQLPKGSTVEMLGQVRTMERAFSGLLFGLLGAIVLIYLLIVVNFQSWTDPAVIVGALPAALAGIVWMLFATGTTLSVPALTGAIMCMGVATANSVLVITFARERLAELGDASAAALDAGFVRFRPVLMTALAMIIGMLPMALGLGEGGEQNAPLGRAVIGGLLFSTVATLVFVPVLFSLVHDRKARNRAALSPISGVPVYEH